MPADVFMKQLDDLGLSPKAYLESAKILAKANGYPTDKLDFALDNNHKLAMTTPSGKVVRFGKATYNDYILWQWLEINGEVAEGTAKQRRRLYHSRADNIKGDWRDDPYSPNNLARLVIW